MRILFLFAILVSASPAAAQELTVAPAERTLLVDGTARAGKTSAPFTPVHVTDRLSALPESQAALAEYQALKDAGLLPVARKGAADPLFTVRDFQVYNFVTRARQTINFTLVKDEPRFLLWVQTSEWGGRVTETVAERLRSALGETTPAASFNPNAGIIANDETIFGSPPNVDGDGKTDVLLVDIVDGYDPDTNPSAVTGFFFPSDLGSPVSRDILYLDTYPSLAFNEDEVLVTAAHEYQHLIHARYDPTEVSFVNEGQSEWASTMNGYAPRPVDYIQKIDVQRDALIAWPTDVGTSDDYERAALFTTYLAEQLGPEATGSITRSVQKGAAGYQAVLQPRGLDLTTLVSSFSMANLANDRSLGTTYGYAQSAYSAIHAAVRLRVDGASASSFGPLNQGPIAKGGVDYYALTNIGTFTLTIDAPDGTSNPTPVRSQVKPTIVVRRADGTSQVQPLDLTARQAYTFEGSFHEILIAVPHAALTGTSTFLNYEISASWEQSTAGTRREDFSFEDGRIAYSTSDTGGILVEGYFFRTGDSASSFEDDSRAANRFTVPEGASLASVSVAPLYVNSFGSNPPPGPQDYTLQIWPDAGNGKPGATPLFTLTRIDGRQQTYQFQQPDLLNVFDTVDLTPYKDTIGPLPSTIHISIGNAGSDTNQLVVPVSAFASSATRPSPSNWYMYIAGTPSWAAFSALQSASTGQRPFENRVLPIRATFLVPISTAAEETADLPTRVELEPNYPNPFNPATTLAFSLDRAQSVRLEVHDVLGRRVATLVDEMRTAGRHEVRFDASGLPSGLYFYRVVTASGSQSRSMVLLR